MGAGRQLLAPESMAALRTAGDIGFRPPMLASRTDRPFSSEHWVFERKLDGVRAIISRESGQRPKLWSRNQKSMDASYPELVAALDERGPDQFIADGEIVAFDGPVTSFARLQARIHLTDPAAIEATGVEVQLYLFDLLVLGELDLTRLRLRDRKRLLHQAFDYGDGLKLSNHRNTDGESYFQLACARGWEGLIAKRANSTYQNRRSSDWRKFKSVRGQEFVIGGFTEPSGSRIGFGALLLGYHADGVLRYAGKVGTGYDRTMLRRLRRKMDQLETGKSPFADAVREPGVHWVSPELVAQVGFTEWTGDGRLRHPRFQGLRDDKAAQDVVREQG